MESNSFVLIVFLLAGFMAAMAYYIVSRLNKINEGHKEDDVLTKWLTEMKGSVDKIPNEIERHLKDQKDTLDRQTKLIWERLDASSEVVRAVQKQLGGLQEFGTDMKDLSNILKSPKLRGGLGEQFLYEILENFLPKDLFKTQYKFKNGDTCDAAVFTDKGIIPIDSKFPMENFKAMLTAQTQEERDKFKKVFSSDVKKRIDEISSKYILPEEGTTGQAIMYIPSENVYYELIVNTPEIEDYCHKKNIIMASPNTLSYFLKVLLVAYQQHELEKHAGEILKALGGIKIEAEKFNDDLGVLERHITNSYKSMDGVKNRFGKLFGKIESVQSIEEPEQKKLLE
jgi:DNA recombination protein RmuC